MPCALRSDNGIEERCFLEAELDQLLSFASTVQVLFSVNKLYESYNLDLKASGVGLLNRFNLVLDYES